VGLDALEGRCACGVGGGWRISETLNGDGSGVYEVLRRGLRILCVLANAEVLIRTRKVRVMKEKNLKS
jgi:hypothetical protein